MAVYFGVGECEKLGRLLKSQMILMATSELNDDTLFCKRPQKSLLGEYRVNREAQAIPKYANVKFPVTVEFSYGGHMKI